MQFQVVRLKMHLRISVLNAYPFYYTGKFPIYSRSEPKLPAILIFTNENRFKAASPQAVAILLFFFYSTSKLTDTVSLTDIWPSATVAIATVL